MRLTRAMALSILLVVTLFAYSSLYIVKEGERALVLFLGKIQIDKNNQPMVKMPGLHAKVPLLDTVIKFDARLQTLDVQSSRILTAEQKYVIVDYYAKWRIADSALYYTRTSGEILRAQRLLQQRINDGLRAEFGKRTITEVISGERADIMGLLRQKAQEGAHALGIKVVDVRIKRIDLPPEVSSAVFERMRSDRQKVAESHRAMGKAEAERMRANADATVTVIMANAYAETQKIRARGDGMAAKVYGLEYSKDPEFYAFYRSLQAYQNMFNNKNDVLVLSPESSFFKYYKNKVVNQK